MAYDDEPIHTARPRLSDDHAHMVHLSSIDRQIDGAIAAIARLEARKQALLALGDDEYEDGAALRFDRLIQGKQYSYMALKCEGFWYVTGPTQSGRARTWSELVDFIMSGNMPEVWLVNEYVRVGAA
jgi:hypothetical protein